MDKTAAAPPSPGAGADEASTLRALREQVSAAMDGESSSDDGLQPAARRCVDARALGRLAADPQARAAWLEYHQIGDWLRSAELHAPRDERAFLRDLSQRLRSEPVACGPRRGLRRWPRRWPAWPRWRSPTVRCLASGGRRNPCARAWPQRCSPRRRRQARCGVGARLTSSWPRCACPADHACAWPAGETRAATHRERLGAAMSLRIKIVFIQVC